MEMETIDEQSENLPEEAVNELLSLTKWMTFTAIVLIIFNLLALLGNLSMLSQGANAEVVITILSEIIAVVLGFLVIRKSEAFKRYTELKTDEQLVVALQRNQQFWMITVLVTIGQVVLNMIF